MALTDAQAGDILQGVLRHSPDPLVRLAVTKAIEWKVSRDRYREKMLTVGHKLADLRELVREGFNADTR